MLITPLHCLDPNPPLSLILFAKILKKMVIIELKKKIKYLNLKKSLANLNRDIVGDRGGEQIESKRHHVAATRDRRRMPAEP